MIKSEIDGVYRTFPTEFRALAIKHLRGNEQLADDAMQETLLRAALKQDKFDARFGRQGLHAWLLKILFNVCREMNRKPARAQVDGFDFDAHPEEKETDDYTLADISDESEEYRHILRKVIAHTKMSDLEWACVSARLAGVDHKSIAADLGIQPRTVSTHVRNVIPRMREAATAHNLSVC